MPTARIHRALSELPAADWDALHDGRNPFITHAFLSGLETTGCLRPDWGWTPCHLGLWEGEALVAAAPGYLKANSHGEFVFDHAWAHAYARHGLDYYPKWLCAVPYSPVTGPRLLARDADARRRLPAAIAGFAARGGLSSAHVNFHDEVDDAAFDADAEGAGWLLREDLQYHWRNEAGWRDFDDFLAAMDHKHRKNIRQERRKVREASIVLRVVHGDEASADDLAAMHGFYLATFADYGNSPAELVRAPVRGRRVVLSTRAGATGLAAAAPSAQRLWGGALVTLEATARCLRSCGAAEVTIVAMGWAGRRRTDEDELCAQALVDRLHGRPVDGVDMVRRIRASPEARKFGDPLQPWFAAEDREIALDVDRFSFAMAIERAADGRLTTRAVRPPALEE